MSGHRDGDAGGFVLPLVLIVLLGLTALVQGAFGLALGILIVPIHAYKIVDNAQNRVQQ